MVTTLKLTVKLRTPHPKQAEFIGSTAKRKVIRAGRRSGKTTGLAIQAVEDFLVGCRVLYAVPVQEQVERFWFEVKKALTEPINAGVFRKNETMHVIELPGTEQRIRAKTAFNADTLRGDYADRLILDEFQSMDEDTWRLVGAPMLLDNNGDAIFIYTPPSALSRSVSKARDPMHAAKLYKKAQADTTGRWKTFHFTSHDNPYLDTTALKEITLDMDDRAYRQEIMAEDVFETPGALWTPTLIEAMHLLGMTAPEMALATVNIDPPKSSRPGSDEAGITATGLGDDGRGYCLADRSGLYTPDGWGSVAIELAKELGADHIVAESNVGGEMVRAVIEHIDSNIYVELIAAVVSKYARAVPILARCQRGEIGFVGSFPELEYQMCNWIDGIGWSPDRMDSMVHGFRDIMLGSRFIAVGSVAWPS